MASDAKQQLRELTRLANENGFRVVKSGQHHKLIDKRSNKQALDREGKPLILAGSSSEGRNWDQTITRWKRAGILKEDPKKEGQKGGPSGRRKSQIASPENQEKKRAAIRREADRRRERAGQLRARLEPVVVKLGGWATEGRWSKSGVLPRSLGGVAQHWLTTRGRVERFHDVDAAERAFANLKKGDTLADPIALAVETFFEHWLAHEDPPARFYELLREWKQLPPSPSARAEGAAVELPTKPGPEPETKIVVPANGHKQAEPALLLGPLSQRPPTLALRAALLMGANGAGAEALEIAEDILRLELRDLAGREG